MAGNPTCLRDGDAQWPTGGRLTTQLYFRDEPRNGSDGIFDPALVMTGNRRNARFDLVLA
jgi:hypothetical protein